MKSRKRVFGAVLILISLPVVLALSEALSFYVRNRNNGSIVSSGQKREYLLYVRGATTARSRRHSSSACTAQRDGRPSK